MYTLKIQNKIFRTANIEKNYFIAQI